MLHIVIQHPPMVGRDPRFPLPVVNPWIVSRYGPLNFPNNLHDMHDIYLNIFPKFDREKYVTIEYHMDTFQYFTNSLLIEDDDVHMRLFVQTLEGEVIKWFKSLPVDSLNSWNALEWYFMRMGRLKGIIYTTLLNLYP